MFDSSKNALADARPEQAATTTTTTTNATAALSDRGLVPEMQAAADAPTLLVPRLSPPFDIPEKLRAYYEDRGEHDRDRSWEYCYRYFHHANAEAIKADRDHAALQLGFYLASFGMYRGSAFLLQYPYTVHLGVVDCLLEPNFSKLWPEEFEFGASEKDEDLVPLILKACEDVRAVYLPFAKAKGKSVTDTLVTKVVLGTIGCFPALDTYFNAGCKHRGINVPGRLNSAFIRNMLCFCRDNVQEFRNEQARIEGRYQMRCPLMKLVDAYFVRIGEELSPREPKKTRKRRSDLRAG